MFQTGGKVALPLQIRGWSVGVIVTPLTPQHATGRVAFCLSLPRPTLNVLFATAAAEFCLVSVPEMGYDACPSDPSLPPRGELCIRGPCVFEG